VQLKAPHLSAQLAAQVVDFIQKIRQQELYKLPGVAETLDWAEALGHLQVWRLDSAVVDNTLGIILKYQDDVDKIRGQSASQILEEITAAAMS
jgi:hypothetical protein